MLRQSTVLRALGASVLTLVLASVAAAQHTFYYYVDCPANAFSPGHVFIQIIPAWGPQKGAKNLVYGFYPAGANIFGGAGEIRDDSKRDWDHRVCFDITTKQYNAIAACVRADIAKPPSYHITRFNCVDWANKQAAKAGIVVPSKNRIGIDDPYAVWDHLQKVGAGNKVGRGTVGDNKKRRAPDGGKLAFCHGADYSYTRLEIDGHGNPSAQAARMQLAFFQQSPPPARVGLTNALTLQIGNRTPPGAMISVDWGDGSPRGGEAAVFSHRYRALGTYDLSLLMIDHGSLQVFRTRVTVDRTSSGARLSLRAAPSRPATARNGGCGLNPPAPAHLGSYVSFGRGCRGSAGVPVLGAVGAPSLGQVLRITLTNARPNAPAVLFLGPRTNLALPGGCTLYARPDVALLATVAFGGRASAPLPIPRDPGLIGLQFANQWWVVDPLGALSRLVAMSNGGLGEIGG